MGIKAGGSIGHIAGVVNACQRAGYYVTFGSAEPPVMVDPSVQFLHIPPPKTSGVPYGLNNYRFQSTFAEVAANLLKKQTYGFIYHRLSAVNYLGVILSRRHRLPLIVEYNGSEAWVDRKSTRLNSSH